MITKADLLKSTSFWDRLGISLSGACAIHCLFFPVAIVLLPLWPAAETIHDYSHPILFLFIAPTVYYAVKGGGVPGIIPLLLYTGLAVIALAWILHEWIGLWGESLVTMAGSALLISGHWHNYQHHRKCRHKEDTAGHKMNHKHH